MLLNVIIRIRFRCQAAAVAAEAGRPADGSDDEEMTPPLPPLPKKHNMGLSKYLARILYL